MSSKPSERRVVLARGVAQRWLESQARPEYRLKVFYAGHHDGRGFGNLLRMFRDGHLKVGNIEPIKDLGVQDEFDHIILWSGNHKGLKQLAAYFEKRNYETTGIW